VALPAYAELHCHSHFSFLDGASAPDDLVARAAELGLAGLAITDHQGLYGAVRFSTAARAAGVHPVIGVEIELLDPAIPDPSGIVIPAVRAWRPGRRGVPPVPEPPRIVEGRPARPRPERARLPGHRAVVKEDHRGIGEGQRGAHLVLLARDMAGWRSLCRMVSRANLAGTKAVPRFTQQLLADTNGTRMLGNFIVESLQIPIFVARGAALILVLLALLVVPIVYYLYSTSRASRERLA